MSKKTEIFTESPRQRYPGDRKQKNLDNPIIKEKVKKDTTGKKNNSD